MDYEIGDEAWEAIKKGMEEKEPVAQLQLLGLETRRINQLEESEYKIITLDQLMKFSPQGLLEIGWLGEQGVKAIYKCLAKYHELEGIRNTLEPGRYGKK